MQQERATATDTDRDSSAPTLHVTLDDLARVPVERLARLLMERAADDPTLLARLHATIEGEQTPPSSEPTPLHIIGNSPAIRDVIEMIQRFVRTDEPVLITGESGTGKELAARAIHDTSRRHSGPFVAVNCAAIPANLVASELFGYEKGAFTGANTRTKGQIEHAHCGTLFLDEIGDMPFDLQGHLLRFLQDGHITRVGGREAIKVDVRIVAATNVRLQQAITDGALREDLYYRLNVLALHLPPLRERREDIELLARNFLTRAGADFGRNVVDFEPAALDVLRGYDWPGNVRELMSMVRRAVVIGDAELVRASDLVGIQERVSDVPTTKILPRPNSPEEREALLAALSQTQENISLTAQQLGVSRVTLYRMLRRHSISLSRGLKAPPVGSPGEVAS
jgi:transcriptional regulator with PAS, ATPase and Fis domain